MTTSPSTISPSTTTISKSLQLTVIFDYSLGEPARRPTPSDPGDPGEPPWVEILEVWLGDTRIDQELSDEDLSDIEILTLESIDQDHPDYDPISMADYDLPF